MAKGKRWAGSPPFEIILLYYSFGLKNLVGVCKQDRRFAYNRLLLIMKVSAP
jgi:hypothetical protein